MNLKIISMILTFTLLFTPYSSSRRKQPKIEMKTTELKEITNNENSNKK